MSLDQYLSIRLIHWRSIHFKFKQAFITVTLLVVFFIIFNLHILITFGFKLNKTSNETNGSTTEEVICYFNPAYPQTQWMETWGRIHLLFYSVLPFTIIIMSNLALLIFLFKRKKGIVPSIHRPNTINSTNKKKFANLTIKFVTLLFIFTTLPNAFASFFFSELFKSDLGSTFVIAANCISFSYHGLNLFTFYLTNKIYRLETKNILHKSFNLVKIKIFQVIMK